MLVVAACENGTVHIPPGLRLKHDHVTVTIQIPDSEVEDGSPGVSDDPLTAVTDDSVRGMMEEIRSIRGTAPGPGRGLTDDDLLRDALTRVNDEQRTRG